jgi:hypothetical protein
VPTQYRQGDILLVPLGARLPALAAGRRVPPGNNVVLLG